MDIFSIFSLKLKFVTKEKIIIIKKETLHINYRASDPESQRVILTDNEGSILRNKTLSGSEPVF